MKIIRSEKLQLYYLNYCRLCCLVYLPVFSMYRPLSFFRFSFLFFAYSFPHPGSFPHCFASRVFCAAIHRQSARRRWMQLDAEYSIIVISGKSVRTKTATKTNKNALARVIFFVSLEYTHSLLTNTHSRARTLWNAVIWHTIWAAEKLLSVVSFERNS